MIKEPGEPQNQEVEPTLQELALRNITRECERVKKELQAKKRSPRPSKQGYSPMPSRDPKIETGSTDESDYLTALGERQTEEDEAYNEGEIHGKSESPDDEGFDEKLLAEFKKLVEWRKEIEDGSAPAIEHFAKEEEKRQRQEISDTETKPKKKDNSKAPKKRRANSRKK